MTIHLVWGVGRYVYSYPPPLPKGRGGETWGGEEETTV